MGLATTRFVEAENANVAIDEVMKLVKNELNADNRTTHESTLELVEIREDAEAFDKFSPGEGFTFS